MLHFIEKQKMNQKFNRYLFYTDKDVNLLTILSLKFIIIYWHLLSHQGPT